MIAINIARPETKEEVRSLIEYVEGHNTLVQPSQFYYWMKEAFEERDSVIQSSGYKFYFWFESEEEAKSFRLKFNGEEVQQ